jgi:uncharacterized protein (DUF952 family)
MEEPAPTHRRRVVLFHIATRSDWERATHAGTYTTDSLHDRGWIGCSTAGQHAAVADARFPGRTDLVLLLIDAERLASEVRFEQADAGGPPFPHVYGPVDLDAVFEVASFRPGASGGFQPHEEASGFAAHGAATLREATLRAAAVMAGYARPWWVAGGWAIDLALGRRTRPHADLEISVLALDQRALFERLRGWDLRLAAPGASLPRWDGSAIEPPFHQVWARRGPGAPSTPEDFAADPTMLGFLLEQSRAGRWVFRRHPTIDRPLRHVGAATQDGVPFVRPEIALLFKAKATRFKDQRDFDRVLPCLDDAARSWLASALKEAHPGHAWRARL